MNLGEQIILVLLGAGVGIGGNLALTYVNGLRETRARDEQRIADLNDKVSSAHALVRAVLADALPDRIIVNAHAEHSRQLLEDLQQQWQPARLALFAASDRHPDAEVREAAHKLTVWVGNVLIQSGWLVRAVLDGKDFGVPEQRANDAHETATGHADTLAERIRLQTDR